MSMTIGRSGGGDERAAGAAPDACMFTTIGGSGCWGSGGGAGRSSILRDSAFISSKSLSTTFDCAATDSFSELASTDSPCRERGIWPWGGACWGCGDGGACCAGYCGYRGGGRGAGATG